MNEAEKKFKSNATVTKRVTIPMLVWEEWERDCVANFNNTYHLKMQFDHEFKKQFAAVSNLIIQDLAELKMRVESLEIELEDIKSLELSKPTQDTKKSPKKTYG